MNVRTLDAFPGNDLQAEAIDRIGDDIVILENPSSRDLPDFPFRSASSISIITVSGSMACDVDLTHHDISTPGILIILPSQIVEKIAFGEDFRGYGLIMSESFSGNLSLANKIPLLSEIRQTAFYALGDLELDSVVNYAKMIQGALRNCTRYRMEIVTHLTIAYYYGLGTFLHERTERDGAASRYEQIAEAFIATVRENCREHRDMEFYAETLHLSAKHISQAVKTVTGCSAMKWIERHTILNAKSLLTTSGLTISEIAYKLSFPSPSDFGKYFRKFTGMSPKEFRKNSLLGK